METKINIAAILKDKPQGTKLYDWLHNIDVEDKYGISKNRENKKKRI